MILLKKSTPQLKLLLRDLGILTWDKHLVIFVIMQLIFLFSLQDFKSQGLKSWVKWEWKPNNSWWGPSPVVTSWRIPLIEIRAPFIPFPFSSLTSPLMPWWAWEQQEIKKNQPQRCLYIFLVKYQYKRCCFCISGNWLSKKQAKITQLRHPVVLLWIKTYSKC